MKKASEDKQSSQVDTSGKVQIDLLVSKKDLKEIVAGTKVEDYRTLSRYNGSLLANRLPGNKWNIREDITHVRFVDGYRNCKFVVCEIDPIQIFKYINFVPKGMKPGTLAFTIFIRRVVTHNL